MFYVSRTHQNLRKTPKLTWKFHFLSIEPIKRCKNANEPIKLHNNWNAPNKSMENEEEPIKSSKGEDEPKKTWLKAKTPNRIARKEPKTCLRVHMSTEMEEIDGEERRLMWL